MKRLKGSKLRKAEQRVRIARRQIQTRAYWGTDTKIKEYKNAVTDSVDLDPLRDALDDFKRENIKRESLIQNLMGSIDFQGLFATSMVENLREIIAETYKQGGSRVITVKGNKLEVGEVDPRRIQDQLQSQDIYLKNLSDDAQERVRDSLVQGANEGKTVSDMKDDILNDVDSMVDHRAENIARSETIEASAKGSKQAMEEAGVDKVTMVAEIDQRNCEEGSFSFKANGKEYTSCPEWDGEVFDREDAPTPVKSSHPQCRCAVAAYVE